MCTFKLIILTATILDFLSVSLSRARKAIPRFLFVDKWVGVATAPSAQMELTYGVVMSAFELLASVLYLPWEEEVKTATKAGGG